MNIASKIISLREARGYSTTKLAKLSGVSQSYLRDIEIGKSQPTVDVLERILLALDISLSNFFTDSEIETIPESLKNVVASIKNLQSSQLAVIKSVVAEFSLINQQLLHKNNNRHGDSLTYELLDLLEEKTTPFITIAGKPISSEERIKLLEALDVSLKEVE